MIAMAPAQDVATRKPMLLLRLSFAHLQRSRGGILTTQLNFMKEVKGAGRALFPRRRPSTGASSASALPEQMVSSHDMFYISLCAADRLFSDNRLANSERQRFRI